MDIIARAALRREELKAELGRIETFLATAYELEQELAGKTASRNPTPDRVKADAPVRRVMGTTGSGAVTLAAVVEILKDRGKPMSTRELLPLVLARGIEVGGKDAVATLSARISSKGVVGLNHGKWWLLDDEDETSAAADEETADIPAKETPAASLFNANQENDAMPPP